MIELGNIKIEKEGEMLSSLHSYVKAVEFLLNKSFFKQLLYLYQEVGKTQGVKEWMELHELMSDEDADCESCLKKKKNLVRTLIFQLDTSGLMDALDNIEKTRADLTDVHALMEELG